MDIINFKNVLMKILALDYQFQTLHLCKANSINFSFNWNLYYFALHVDTVFKALYKIFAAQQQGIQDIATCEVWIQL